jgi:rare lipoprotein A
MTIRLAMRADPIGADRARRRVLALAAAPWLWLLPLTGEAAPAQVGVASIYAHRLDGRLTASGERYDAEALTAAHRTQPFGTRVRVTNLRTRRSVVVRINDPGPARRDRLIDLTPRAAARIGLRSRGLARVRVQPLVEPEPAPGSP